MPCNPVATLCTEGSTWNWPSTAATINRVESACVVKRTNTVYWRWHQSHCSLAVTPKSGTEPPSERTPHKHRPRQQIPRLGKRARTGFQQANSPTRPVRPTRTIRRLLAAPAAQLKNALKRPVISPAPKTVLTDHLRSRNVPLNKGDGTTLYKLVMSCGSLRPSLGFRGRRRWRGGTTLTTAR